MSRLWTMRYGTEIDIADMDDNHLLNSYHMVARAIPPSTSWVKILNEEIKRRGLKRTESRAILSNYEGTNYHDMLEAEYSAWEMSRD